MEPEAVSNTAYDLLRAHLTIAGTEGWSKNRVKKSMDDAARHITQGLDADLAAPDTVCGSHFRKTAHRFPTAFDPTALLPHGRSAGASGRAHGRAHLREGRNQKQVPAHRPR
ncbi:MAG: hypothetical protein ACRYFX_15900 [Janthinobacterium lividum]